MNRILLVICAISWMFFGGLIGYGIAEHSHDTYVTRACPQKDPSPDFHCKEYKINGTWYQIWSHGQ